eukprot:Gb_24492 [translate_table: standard]
MCLLFMTGFIYLYMDNLPLMLPQKIYGLIKSWKRSHIQQTVLEKDLAFVKASLQMGCFVMQIYQDVKVGQFIIEYCGEVISCKEARRRSQAYEAEGLKDAFIICLNRYESIDATRKGSLVRFINHSCEPNSETRQRTVLGEIRVGIFPMQDIPVGTELAYDYNFESYGGAKVRCHCGAASCFGLLGAKSCGFQKD